MKNVFTKHPHSLGEGYFQHMKFASLFGFNMILGGLACLTHAVFPFVFERTGSNCLFKMMRHFIHRMPSSECREMTVAEFVEPKTEHHQA